MTERGAPSPASSAPTSTPPGSSRASATRSRSTARRSSPVAASCSGSRRSTTTRSRCSSGATSASRRRARTSARSSSRAATTPAAIATAKRRSMSCRVGLDRRRRPALRLPRGHHDPRPVHVRAPAVQHSAATIRVRLGLGDGPRPVRRGSAASSSWSRRAPTSSASIAALPAEDGQFDEEGRRIALHLEDAPDEQKRREELAARPRCGEEPAAVTATATGTGTAARARRPSTAARSGPATDEEHPHRHGAIYILMGGGESPGPERNGFTAVSVAMTNIFEEVPAHLEPLPLAHRGGPLRPRGRRLLRDRLRALRLGGRRRGPRAAEDDPP